MTRKKVLVAMSGGVDSSATCLMLQEQGFEVVGMTMRVYDLPGQFKDGKDEPEHVRSARELAEQLGIKHYVADVREEFRQSIVQYFLDEYKHGRTPNPCVRCNRDFKFRLMREWADKLGCDYMATGHYVRLEKSDDGFSYLVMGDDIRKDQTYFLWRVPQQILQRCIFPLGTMQKPEVRAYLAEKGFTVKAKQSESMEVCFIAGDYRDFLREQCPELEEEVKGGTYVNAAGKKLGTHEGVPFYTVGQRKGLGIALGKPAYVLRLNPEKNTIVLGEEDELLQSVFFCEDDNIVNPDDFFSTDALTVRVRYHSHPVACQVTRLEDGRLLVRTAEPVSAITPGQSAVFYVGSRLVGGAVIASQKGIGMYQ